MINNNSGISRYTKVYPKNKKGNTVLILIFFLILFVILAVGFVMVIGSAMLNYVFDEITPELTTIGTVGSANMSQAFDITFGTLDTIVQNFTWLTGVLYVILLIASFGIIFVIKATPSKWLMGLYFLLVIMLIIGCIFMSNIYEDFYDGTDDLAIRLKEHVILSWMILYSPFIFAVISLTTGAILFSGLQMEEDL